MNQNILARHRNLQINSYLCGNETDSTFNDDICETGQSLSALGEDDAKTLSIVATAYDVRDAVRIIRKQPEGVSLAEAMDPFKKRVLHPQKIAVYERWGIVLRDGDWLRLSPLGWELAQRTDPEVAVFRKMLETNPQYMSALNWAYQHRLDRISHLDVIAHWSGPEEMSASAVRKSANKVNAICFFHLCQAAELGTVTLGKRGQPARLSLDREELGRRLSAPPYQPETATAEERSSLKLLATGKSGGAATVPVADLSIFRGGKPRVLISCSRQSSVTHQVQSAMTIADFDCAVVEREEKGVTRFIDEALRDWGNFFAGVVILTVEDLRKDTLGDWRLHESVAMALGAVCAFCDNRVVALCESGLATQGYLPGYLMDLNRCEFDGESLNWESGVQLMEVIKGWKI